MRPQPLASRKGAAASATVAHRHGARFARGLRRSALACGHLAHIWAAGACAWGGRWRPGNVALCSRRAHRCDGVLDPLNIAPVRYRPERRRVVAPFAQHGLRVHAPVRRCCSLIAAASHTVSNAGTATHLSSLPSIGPSRRHPGKQHGRRRASVARVQLCVIRQA